MPITCRALITTLFVGLSACGGGSETGSSDHSPAQTSSGVSPLSGIVEITISGMGTDEIDAKAEVFQQSTIGTFGAAEKSAAQLTNVPTVEFKRIASSSTEVGVRGAGGRRFVSAAFAIRNADRCLDLGNCPASPVERKNVTLMAVAAPFTINESSVIRLDRFDGSPADPNIVFDVLPGHGMNILGTESALGLESFQVFREEELPPKEANASFVLPYGFVVDGIDGTSRTLPANPPAQQFDGIVTIAFSLPLQANREDDPFRISVAVQYTEDGNTRVTQSLEERSPEGDLATLARANKLNTTDIVTLGCDRLPANVMADTLCEVRLTGPVGAPTAYIVQTDSAAFEPQAALSDEFNGVSLDRTKWCTRFVFGGLPNEETRNEIQPGFEDSFCTRFEMFGGGRGDVVNDEQQRYRDVDPSGNLMHQVSGGTLKLRASQTLPNPFPNQQSGNFANPAVNDGTVKYESAMISSKATFKPEDSNTVYVVKARLKLPDVQGTFPAMWLYPAIDEAGGQWPPEIDIMESALNRVEDIETQIVQGTQLLTISGVPPQQTVSGLREITFIKNELVSPYAGGFTGQFPGYETQFSRWIAPTSLRERFVEVGAHWREDGVCFFVDNTKTVCENYEWLAQTGLPANPAVLIFNMAIGGSFAGRHGIEDAALPVATEIDWVRTWKVTVPST